MASRPLCKVMSDTALAKNEGHATLMIEHGLVRLNNVTIVDPYEPLHSPYTYRIEVGDNHGSVLVKSNSSLITDHHDSRIPA